MAVNNYPEKCEKLLHWYHTGWCYSNSDLNYTQIAEIGKEECWDFSLSSKEVYQRS